jgi:hypothetical protein
MKNEEWNVEHELRSMELHLPFMAADEHQNPHSASALVSGKASANTRC